MFINPLSPDIDAHVGPGTRNEFHVGRSAIHGKDYKIPRILKQGLVSDQSL